MYRISTKYWKSWLYTMILKGKKNLTLSFLVSLHTRIWSSLPTSLVSSSKTTFIGSMVVRIYDLTRDWKNRYGCVLKKKKKEKFEIERLTMKTINFSFLYVEFALNVLKAKGLFFNISSLPVTWYHAVV